MNAYGRILKSLKLRNEISKDIKNCIDKRKVIRENICPHCRSEEYTSNGNKINSKGSKIPRYICNRCKRTFYLITTKSVKENKEKPLDLYSLQIRKEHEIFLFFLNMYLRVEYERMLRSIIKDKDNPNYEYAKKELAKVENKMTNRDILAAIRREEGIISERTIVRWRNKVREGLEGIVEKYSDSPLDEYKWFEFLKEANQGYGLWSGDSKNKQEFDRFVFWLIVLAEDNKLRKNMLPGV